MLTLRTLGTLAASVDSAEGLRQLGRGKPVALLAFLAASPGRKASRERLASLLWSEGTNESARQNLRQTVWYLRRRLGAVVEATDELIALDGALRCDRDEFLQAVREQRLRDAVECYTGEFIPEFAAPGAAEFEQWADLERRRLRAVLVGCCDTLAREALAQGQPQTAAQHARRARDADPFDLGPWRLLLEALVAARDTVGALAEAEALEAHCEAHELEPDDATRAALRLARQASQAGRPTGRPAGPVAAPLDEHATFAPELIGREVEFRQLLEAWEAARAGRGSALLVTGSAGLGKSRLLTDLHARLRAGRVRAVLLRANPGDRAVAGGFVAALAEAIAQRPGAAAISSESAGVLVALAPALASAYPNATGDRSSGEDATRRRVGALLELLRAVSDEHPLALLVDDLHWADEESRRVLEAIAARLAGGPVLLVLSARPPVEALGSFHALPRIELPRLDLPRTAEFVSRLGELPTEPWAGELPSQLLTATRGVPLTIIEALQRLLELGALVLEDHRWSCPRPHLVGELLRDGMVLESRVRSLGAGARELLLVLATLGRPLPAGQVASDARLAELEQRGFVQRAEGELHVAHDEVAAAALAVASDDERTRAHAQAAALLAEGPLHEGTTLLALRHAARGQATALLSEIGARWVRLQRGLGRGESAAELLREALGQETAPALRRMAVARVPWWQRPSRLARGVAAATIAVASVLGAWRGVRESPEPDLELLVQVAGNDSTWARITIADLDEWPGAAPIVADRMARADLPEALRTVARARMLAMPDGSGFVGYAFFPDSGGDELLVADADGRPSRPAAYRGDDGGIGVSPDGRYVAFASARWHPETDRYNIALLDRRDGSVKRLIASEDFDSVPLWSPDGTRIAFYRNSFTRMEPHRLCVAHMDGAEVRCDWRGLPNGVVARGWLDDTHVVLEETFSSRILAYSLETESAEPIGTGTTYETSDGRVYVVEAGVAGVNSLSLLRADLRGGPRAVLLDGQPLRGQVRLSRGRAAQRPHFVDRIQLVVPADGVPVDLTHRLRVEAFDSGGQPVRAHAQRFRSLDPDVAIVEGDRLRPRRLGTVRVEATLGGWRRDTAELRIVPSTVREVVAEDWSAGLGARWRAFGEPLGRVGRGARGPQFEPSGDGRYPSGVYLQEAIDLSAGLGVEFDFSMPVDFSRLQWQDLQVALLGDVDPARLAAWDHRTGPPAMSEHIHCGIGFGGEGGHGFANIALTVAGRASAYAPTPPGLFSGRWHRVRLQVFPDGRCALALDGRPFLLGGETLAMGGVVYLRISGHSVGTTVAVGPLRVWQGVRGGVEWEPPKRGIAVQPAGGARVGGRQ